MQSRLARRAGSVALSLVLVLGACSDDDDTSAPSTTDTSTTSSSVPCEGDPIKLMSIVSVTGPVSAPEVGASLEAAAQAVNTTCAAGRPIDLDVCDDEGDANLAQDCARQAVEGEYLALVGSLSVVIESALPITDEAGIPNFGNIGSSAAELTSPNSFPLGGTVSNVLGHAATIAAAGGTTMSFVGPDIPQIALFAGIVEKSAGELGVTLEETVLIPVGATDYAQFAAQALGTDGIAMIASGAQAAAFTKALIDAGIDFDETTVSLPQNVSPEDIEGFDGAADGAYVSYSSMPASSMDVEGVAQYQKEMEAAGKGDLARGGSAITTWRAVHLMAEEILPALDTIDAASMIEFLSSAAFAPGDIAPTDFTKPAFPDDPTLSALRLFSPYYIPGRIVDGDAIVAADAFVDVREPFTLTK